MKARIQALMDKIDALSLRERGLLFAALVVGLVMGWDALLMTPLDKQRKQASAQLDALRGQVSALELQAQAIVTRQSQDPDRENRRRLENIERRSAEVDRQLAELTVAFIAPSEMSRALEEALRRSGNLRLVRLEGLGPEPLLPQEPQPVEPGGGEAASAVPGAYTHRVVMEFEGGYMDTLAYLERLEALPWRFHWKSLDYKVIEYPTARVTIEVETLGLTEGWIGV